MSIIEQAARRLEELKRAGIEVPWAAAGLTEGEVRTLAGRNGDPVRIESVQSEATDTAATAVSGVRLDDEAPTPEARLDELARHRQVAVDFACLAREGCLGYQQQYYWDRT